MGGTYPGMIDAERLEALVDELAERLTQLPEAAFTRRSAPDEWTAAEVVAHMTEMMPYWARALSAVAADPSRRVGRALDDPDRVGAVAGANQVPRAEALTRLRHAAHETAAAISRFDEDTWRAERLHDTRGPMGIGEAVRALVIEHAEGHVRQALTAAGGAPAAHSD
jgi:uncharacterized damage-inducible protein DinB